MKKEKNSRFIDLNDSELKKNPFSVPENYFSDFEEEVRLKIHKSSTSKTEFFHQIKSYIALAASFAIVFLIGYGVLSLTPLLDRSGLNIENDDFTALIDNGFINVRFVDYLYDEIEMQKSVENSEIVLPDSFSELIADKLSEEEIIEYLNSSSSDDK